MKRTVRLLLAAVLAAGLGAILKDAPACATLGSPPVLVVIRGVPAFEAARRGFVSRLPLTQVVELDPDMSGARAALERVQRLVPPVVVALGSAAAIAADQYLPATPMVLGFIFQPGLLAGGQNPRCGFTLTVDAEVRIAALGRLFTPLKSLAILSGPEGDPEANLLLQAARARGVEVQWLRVEKPQEIAAALRSLDRGRQALVLTTEALFLKEEVSRALIRQTLEARLPVVGFSEKTVRMGGLAAIEVDYRRHGVELARAAEVLMARQAETGCGFSPVKEYLWVLNLQTARTLGLPIPRDVLEDAGLAGGEGGGR